jgi:site-specific DNA recombinase
VTARPARKFRCAIYTRKSSEEGLEQEFNSLHAQREAGIAYVASQKSEGWIALPDTMMTAGSRVGRSNGPR